MSLGSDSAASVFVFVYLRSARNSLLRLLRRLQEPRYLIGFLLGVVYFLWIFGRNRFGAPPPRAPLSLPAQGVELGLLLASAAFTAILLGSWVLRRGRADLSLSEAEAQFFFPAPLAPRAVVHYALLRPQAALLLSSLFLVIVLGRGELTRRVPMVLGTWCLLSTLRLHWLGIAFARSSWEERGRAARERLATLAALSLLALLLFSGLDAVRNLIGSLAGSSPSIEEIDRAVSSRRLAGVTGILLLPARALLAPLFAPSLGELLWRLLPALGILAAHYLWVLHAASGYEEATLDGALRRAERRARRLAGRTQAAPTKRRRRGVVPFALPSLGRPEVAIVWKNLISWQRLRLARFGRGLAAVCLALFVLFRVLASRGFGELGLPAGACVFALAGFLALFLPIGSRYDLRADLDYLTVIRAWPLAPRRLVAAELATPWLLSIGLLLSGLLLSGAIVAGSITGESASTKTPGADVFPLAAPLILAALAVLPGVSAFVVLVQNGLTLAFPAWFHQRERRVTTLERTGSGMVMMLVTFVVLALAALPCALIGGGLWWLLGSTLGVWVAPIAAALSTALLGAAAYGAIRILAELLEGFDPSAELGP